ncbi:hypothetical protein, partial [Salmonella enterica]|uniref:hypothetical protein n=1 Tax=Salmonella enterica TaxID=28901 RepID=UPI003D2E8B54
MVTITSGTGAGQTRIITAYVGSTKVATVNATWQTNPDATSVYTIYGEYLPVVNSSGYVGIQTGTGTGQLDFTSGVVKSNVTQLLGT